MHEAELSETMTDLGRAYAVSQRIDGRALGICPIRRKNFTALEIGRSLREN